MDCLDCLLEAGRRTPAVGTCDGCGAGVCLDHAVILEHRLTRPAAILREIPVDPPARLLRCPTCQAAHLAVQGQAVRSHDLGVTPPAPLPLRQVAGR